MAEMQSGREKIDNQYTDELVPIDLNAPLCSAEANEYFMNIKEELNQIDRLVSDAVNNLVINFKYISTLTKSHHDMVLVIEKMAAPEGGKPILELLEKQMVIADKIEQELEMAITSLQFGDLVTQLLAHTARQVEVLNMELQRIDRLSNWKDRNTTLQGIHEDISKAVNMADSKSKRKPVVQQGMQMGDIELF
ncbi:MAG: hypothetical protein KA524_00710 [Nitrosomonas sp.]|nr:hypothetical protein [Nitrosomonas sp.]MBP6075126.1 hypothetical protein [Nitrosomonas sp.]